MAKKKLTEDELKWILSIDATEAQQEIHQLEKDSKKLTATNKDLKAKMTDLVAEGKRESEAYKNLSAEVERNNNKIKLNKEKINELEKTLGLTALTMAQLRKKAKDLQRQLDNTSNATSPEKYKQLEQSLSKVQQRMSELRTSGQQTGSTLAGSFSRISIAFKAFLALEIVRHMKDIVMRAFEVRTEFAKYEAVLRNTFQSETKAVQAMTMLKKLAKDTPYSLQEITEAYIKMINRGMKPTETEIIKLGDLAASQGKSLDQLIEALLDAQTNEFERLKEFGIKASKEGDKVKFTFKGVTTEVKATDEAISNYILSLGDLTDVQGGMATQMKELGGKASNLGDSMDALFNVIGKRIEPTAKKILTWLTRITDGLKVALSTIDELNQEGYNDAAQNAYKDTQEQADVMINRMVKNGMDKKKAIERSIDILRKQSNADLVKAEQEQAALEARLATNLWPSARKNLEQALERKKGEVLRFKSELEALDDKEKSFQPKKQTISESEHKKQNAAFKLAMDLKLQQMENAHKEELSLLKKNKLETHETEQQFNMQILDADAKYYTERIEALKNYQQKTSDPKVQVQLAKQITDTQTSLLDTQKKKEEEMLKALKADRDKQLLLESQTYKMQKATFEKSLLERSITQQQFDALTMSADASSAEARLKISQQYQTNVTALELRFGAIKAQAVQEANNAVLDADLAAAKARATQQKALQNLVKDFKSEFKLTTIGEDTEMQMQVLEASYKARKEMAEKEHMDTTELDAAYEKAKTKLLQQEEDRRNQIKQQYGLLSLKEQYEIERANLKRMYDEGLLSEAQYEKAKTNLVREEEDKRIQIRKDYGLLSLQEQYDLEQELLKEQYDQGLINEEAYQEAKNKIKVDYLKKSYDTYSEMFTGAISALQDAELANIDAKYDAEIARAGSNSEEVARLEKEKENKKLAVQKKYAGVNFAIKVSEIIANTAVAVMQAFAQLGPIGGAIAAAMLGATSIAQIGIANTERKKVMSMTVDGGVSSGSSSGTRVLVGKETGGLIDVARAQDGQEFEAVLDPDKRGFVDRPTVIVGEGPAGHSKEWVASNDALENPTVAPFINVLNEAQEKGVIRTIDMNQLMRQRLAGFSKGGFINNPEPTPVTPSTAPTTTHIDQGNSEYLELMRKLYALFTKLDKEGLPAFLVQSEFEKEQKRLEQSRQIGSKS